VSQISLERGATVAAVRSPNTGDVQALQVVLSPQQEQGTIGGEFFGFWC